MENQNEKLKEKERKINSINKNHGVAIVAIGAIVWGWEIYKLYKMYTNNYKWGEYYFNKKEYNKAYQCYLKAHENGDSRATYSLSLLYKDGLGVLENHQISLKFIEESANKGNEPAQLKLAECYREGKLVEKDLEKSIQILKLYSSQGYLQSTVSLAFKYYYGTGVEVDLQKVKK